MITTKAPSIRETAGTVMTTGDRRTIEALSAIRDHMLHGALLVSKGLQGIVEKTFGTSFTTGSNTMIGSNMMIGNLMMIGSHMMIGTGMMIESSTTTEKHQIPTR